MIHVLRKIKNEEAGSEIIEYLGLLPILLMVGVIIVQLFLAGQTFLVTVSAAREGARAAAACGDIGSAVDNAIGSAIRHSWRRVTSGDEEAVTVIAEVPSIFRSILGYQGTIIRMPELSYTSKMRRERTRCGY